jgi:DNA-binding MarR family transcriptional regulator
MTISKTQIQALAGFRTALRRFLAFSEEATRAMGVSTQQYQAMLAIEAQPLGTMFVGELAEEMLLRPNAAVQLVDRLAAMGLVQRHKSTSDRRSVRVSLTGEGKSLFLQLATLHLDQLNKRKKQLADIVRQLKQVHSRALDTVEEKVIASDHRRRGRVR